MKCSICKNSFIITKDNKEYNYKKTVYDNKVCDNKVCDACDDSGRSYWSDGIYGNCMMCCCIECGEKKKFCTCITCDKCGYTINSKDKHQ